MGNPRRRRQPPEEIVTWAFGQFQYPTPPLNVFDEDVVRHYQQFLHRRRAQRPAEEYRPVTDAEWAEFEEHLVDCTTSRSMTGLAARPGGGTWCGRGHAAGAGRRAAICTGGGRGGQGRDIGAAVRGRGRRWRASGAGRRVLAGS